DGAVSPLQPEGAAELARHVGRDTVDRHERDFLEPDDIRLEACDDLGDQLQPRQIDVPPPGGWKRTRPDRGTNVVRDDRQAAVPGWRCEGYLTEPASRPWTKYRWRLKKTSSGTTISRNAPAARRCHSVPYWLRRLWI